jgi:hypothetical protein
MCDALTALGFPGRHLRLIRPHAPYPTQAEIVVDTPTVRAQFGSANASSAPAVLTTIGTGSTAISIRVIAPDGAAAYDAALKADVKARRTTSWGLLNGPQVKMPTIARGCLRPGRSTHA